MERMNKEMNGQLSLAIQIFKDEYPKRFLHQLVSGQLDMDRLDYLRRDSFYTGVTEGNIGSARIIKMLDVADDRLVIESKGIYSIENFLTARRLMYWQVYLHKTSVAYERMLIKMCIRDRIHMSPHGWFIRSMKQSRNPKNSGSYREQPMPSRTKRINRNTPTKYGISSGGIFIKPIITRSFGIITEKVSIFANVK